MVTGLIYADKITGEAYSQHREYIAHDGTTYPPGFPPEENPWLRVVDPTDRPGDAFRVTGWHADANFAQVWECTPIDDRSIYRAEIISNIERLEQSITDRMWREDAVGSSEIMNFGDGDPRTGKTATQYIAWVNNSIAEDRGKL